ncbi:MAG: DUF1194 domain-containing protein [Hyphomicrobiaceae bacterium]
MGKWLVWLFSGVLFCVGMSAPQQHVRAQPTPSVDVALLLAVDISLSMDPDEQKLQRNGYVAAFRHPDVIKAIASGLNGRIAVSYLEWAGLETQDVVVDWQVIASRLDAEAFATELASRPIRRARMTSISAALLLSLKHFGQSGVLAARRVIDVSGDGPNNSGIPVLDARRRVLDKGVVINGLAIQIKRGQGSYSYFDLPDLDRYYAACVIGGPGSFMLVVKDKDDFAEAIRRKLLLEIAGRHDGEARVLKTQFAPQKQRPIHGCLVGEKRWGQYLRELWRD